MFQKGEINKVCTTVTDEIDLYPRHFLVNGEHKLLYCWIHKVASTSWIALFSHLANRTNIEEYYREIKFLSPKTTEELQSAKRYYKIIAVRHPFQRLVSAYRDRIQDNSRFTSQAWAYVPRIFALTRPKLHRGQIFKNAYYNHCRLLIVPSFEEFVTWLLSIPSEHYDVHWNLYSQHCDPCSLKYDAVIKMDNFTGLEEEQLMKDMGIDQLNLSLEHFQKTLGGPTTFNITCQYFQQLTLDQAQGLYEVYQRDFKMFSYSPLPYMKCAKNHNIPDVITLLNNAKNSSHPNIS
ncbi:hypothetical protein C0J52_22171 [Blattella germanica]|nr:hypothetical protein C0J52_22171 [Blattella germanica]